MKGRKRSSSLLGLALLSEIILSVGISFSAQAAPVINHNDQIQQPGRTISGHPTGGLIQNLKPNDDISTTLQGQDQQGSLGSSGVTKKSREIVGASTLPTLWNPLNSKSGNYNKVSPVLNQQDLENCWDYSGISAISDSSQRQLGTYQNLLPAYYDYLSAENAFIGQKNPLAIMIDSFDARQLGDGNTMDYIPTMSLLGYGPYLPGQGLSQLMTQAQDISIQKSKFDSLSKANVHVNNEYKLSEVGIKQLPTTTTATMARVNQIKQLVYQYGAAAIGIEAEYSLDYDPDYPSIPSYFGKITNGNYSSYTPYSEAKTPDTSLDSDYYPNLTHGNSVLSDHEVEIVGYDDSYAASNFKKNPGMNGAFVVKNSWGTSWGTKGYFYLSYADVFVATSEIYADGIAKNDSQKIYSAVNTSPNASSGYYLVFGNGGETKTNNNIFANTYTSQNLANNQVETLNAISAWVDEPGIKVNVLYKAGGVSSSTKLSDFKNLGSYSFTDAGYQTIPVNAVPLPNKGTYTVAIQMTNMTNFSEVDVPIQDLISASSGKYPVLTSTNSWYSVNNHWDHLSTDSYVPANLYLDARTQNTSGVTITFNNNGGTGLTSEKAIKGTAAEQPANPVKTDYTFKGWYSDAALTQAYNFSTKLNADITLYAKWQKLPDVPIYRLYNHNTGEHFYTVSAAEKNADVSAGWNYEGIGWTAPAASNAPIYRVYNPNADGGDHYYTKSLAEARSLVNLGWLWDNGGKPVFYSGGSKAVYVAYNPNAQSGAHSYTLSSYEQNSLLKNGWRFGAIAWYGIK